MADPRLILGRIHSVQGNNPDRSNNVWYTISVHDPQIEGVYTLERQAPVRRWPPTLDIIPLAPGDIVIGTVSANRVQWHFMEYPAFADCGGLPITGIGVPEEILRIRRITTAIAVQPGSGQESTPATPEQ